MKMCELNVVKYLFFAFNLIFAISGIGLIIAGTLVLSVVGEFRHFLEGRILTPPVILIVIGCIVFLVASLGCFGAIRESYYMLMAFAVCLLLILIAELTIGIIAAIYKSGFQEGLRDAMKDSMARYSESKVDQVAWDGLHSRLQCCGVYGATDWPKDKRPLSCCHAPNENAPFPEQFHCNSAKPGDEILNTNGCFGILTMVVSGSAKMLSGVGIGVAFIEVVGIILACYLAMAFKKMHQ